MMSLHRGASPTTAWTAWLLRRTLVPAVLLRAAPAQRRRAGRRRRADAAEAYRARGATRGARPQALLRSGAVGFRPNGLRDLPRSGPRLRPAQRACRAARRHGHGAAGPARGAVAEISAGRSAIHRAYYESEDEGDDSVDNGPTGGLTWDGRVDRGRDQARMPLLSPLEMANARCRRGRRQSTPRPITPMSCARSSAPQYSTIATRLLPASEALEAFQQDYRDVLSLQQQVRRLSRRPAELTRRKCAGSRCSTIPQRAIAAIATAASAARTARRRNSPITA